MSSSRTTSTPAVRPRPHFIASADASRDLDRRDAALGETLPSRPCHVQGRVFPTPSPARKRPFTATPRRSAGCAGRRPPAARSRSHRRCGSSGRARRPSRAPPPRLPPPAVRTTKSSSVSMVLPDGAVLPDRPGAGRIDVERAFRGRALQMPRPGSASRRRGRAAPRRLSGTPRDEVLRPVERLDRRPLRDGAGARRLLALHHVHRLDRAAPARPP